MAQNYFRCAGCAALYLLTYRSTAIGQPDWPPPCEDCRGTLELAPQPGDFTMDVRSDGGTNKPVQKFSVDVDGRAVEVDSLHTLRRIERESEQRYRNGEGAPLRFRMWNQDRSNKDVGSFGTAGKIGDQTYDSGTPVPKSSKVDVRRHGEAKPRVPLGPGLRRAVSPLK